MFRWILYILIATSLQTMLGCAHARRAQVDCNPLGGGTGEDCLLPFPSSFYMRPDPASATGLRVHLKRAALPISRLGAELDTDAYDHRDGFSAVATLLAQFPARIDPTSLPDIDRASAATHASSPVQLLRFDTGERVPLFAELDANAEPGQRQALILQPIVRLAPKTRYIAVIQGLRNADDRTRLIEPLTGFKRLRDRQSSTQNSGLSALRPHYEEIFARLKKFKIRREKLQLAWDFTTASDEAVTSRLTRMRDAAFAAPQSEDGIRIDRIEEHPRNAPDLWLRLTGSFQVASFLEGGNGNRLKLGANGEPVIDSAERFPLTVHVPECARDANRPLPVIIYGHGTFNSGRSEMKNDYSTKLINRLCMIEIGTDWLGRAASDLPYFLFRIVPNWNNFRQITDRLQQAHVNVATLARLVRDGTLARLKELAPHGTTLVDSTRLYYYGISEGGCQGVTALALSPDFDRGALNVPCGFWSMFFWRSSDFYYTRRLMKFFYNDPLEQQVLMALSQLQWDYTDPANYGSHLLRNPLPGSTIKRVLYQEGINDASVPNLTTRAMARTIGLKLLSPAIEPVEGVEAASGPLESAYVQYDVGARPRLGLTNVPPAVSAVHEEIRRLDAAQAQLERFLREDGSVVDTCAGKPCLFPKL